MNDSSRQPTISSTPKVSRRWGSTKVIEVAGVVRGSLYKTFGSKDALIEAYLEGQHESTLANLHAQLDSVADPKARILAVFDVQAKTFASPASTAAPSWRRAPKHPRRGYRESCRAIPHRRPRAAPSTRRRGSATNVCPASSFEVRLRRGQRRQLASCAGSRGFVLRDGSACTIKTGTGLWCRT